MNKQDWLTSLSMQGTPSIDECIQYLGDAFPLLYEFKVTEQDPQWHAEGDVHIHTGMVLCALYKLLETEAKYIQGSDRQALILSALFHDIAKPLATRRKELKGIERVVASRHETMGRSYLAHRFLDLKLPYHVVDLVLGLVGEHQMPKLLIIKQQNMGAFWKLAKKASTELLYWLEVADMKGRICDDLDEQLDLLAQFKLFSQEYGVWKRNDHIVNLQERMASHLESLNSTTRDMVFSKTLRDFEEGDISTFEEGIARTYRYRSGYSEVYVLYGPSGSGKEVLAQYVHYNSARSAQPFVAINCAAIPENMLEATLFGYEKGAFTGAIQACPGKFEQAQGGTILLDEITEMDLALQAKILRVLQEREVERLGGRKTIKLDVRVIATSNRDLQDAVRQGEFREDLYYRLNVFPLSWLPLTDRREDIVPLAKHLVAKYSQNSGDVIVDFSAAARSKMLAYHWPGNVRELDNVIQRALILQSGELIDVDDLFIEHFTTTSIQESSTSEESHNQVSDVNAGNELGNELKLQEHQIILDTLQACQGSRKAVAERLGISPRTLRYKIARMRDSGIQIPA